MPTGNTSLLGLALPVEGELSGTWGDVVNDSITSLVDSAVAGTTTLSADSDVTLTDTALATNQARQAIIRWTASNGATTRNITAPARSKPYIVINAGTGSIVLRGAGPTAGVTIVAGERCLVAWSGSDFVKVGGTSGSGTFTDLTVTGNTTLGDAAGDTVTINGATTFANVSPTITPGTANGVAYLNGSKVLTTGSALTFDGSTLAVSRSGGSTDGGGTNNVMFLTTSGTGANLIRFNGQTATDLSFGRANGADAFYWGAVVGASEWMRLTSTGLGIGTSSPSYRLDVQAATAVAQVKSTTSTNAAYYVANNTGGDFYIGRENSAGTTFGAAAYSAVLWSAGAYPMSFFTNGIERARIDSSGNLGLGVTPSAWDTSVFRTVQIGSGAGSVSLSGRSDSTKDMVLGSNVYYGTGNFRYVGTSVATMYRQDGATHAWFTAPSGTAGNAISFTQAMTLDSAGRLGVGVTSPAAPIDVQADSGAIGLQIRGRSASNLGYITFRNNANTANLGVIGSGDGGITFDYNGTERARITSGGDFGIGTSSPSYRLDVRTSGTNDVAFIVTSAGGGSRILFSDGNTGTQASAPRIGGNANDLLFYTNTSGNNSTERARITSGGFFGLGVTSPQAMFDLAGDYKEGVVTANTGTAYTINTATGTLQILTLTGNCTFTFPTAIAGESFTLLLRQDGTGSRTVTWPAAVRWPGGTAPTITATANQTDKYVFTSDGTRWYGSNAGQAYAA